MFREGVDNSRNNGSDLVPLLQAPVVHDGVGAAQRCDAPCGRQTAQHGLCLAGYYVQHGIAPIGSAASRFMAPHAAHDRAIDAPTNRWVDLGLHFKYPIPLLL